MRRAILDQREITEDGTIQVRIAKQVVDGGSVEAEKWHRCAFTPGCDVEATIANVDAHLVEMGYGAVPQDDWNKVRATIAAEQTPAVVAAYEERLAADAVRRAALRS